MKIMRKILQILHPYIRKLEHEKANKVVLYALATLAFKEAKKPKFPYLHQNIWGIDFHAPVGLAAGFDKDALATGGHFHMGFGFVEIGTVTPKKQAGNSKPRIFEDRKNMALINRQGCPSDGLEVFGRRMGSYHLSHEHHWGVVGINFGINADTKDPVEDYRLGMQHVGALADYVTLNLSSPNTKGLGVLMNPQSLEAILETVMAEREKIEARLPALVVKISPDIKGEEIKPICEILLKHAVNGVILTNTTTDRPESLDPAMAREPGGLSGKPLFEKSTGMIGKFYQELQGKIPIIGCGGIDSAEAAYEKIKAGASLVQIYTGLIMKGPALVNDINAGLNKLLAQDGFNSITDAIGSIHKGSLS